MNNLPLDSKVRRQAMFCHLVNIGMWVAPVPLFLIIFIILSRLNAHPFVKEAGKESANFSASIILYVLLIFTISLSMCAAGVSDMSFFFGVYSIGILVITHIVMVIFGGIQANRGISYKYPFAIRFLDN